LENLNFTHNKLQTLNIHSFSGLFQLKHLDLSHNLLETIETSVFNDLRNLLHLNLSNNGLRMIEKYSLNFLNQLKVLDIGQNFDLVLNEFSLSGIESIEILYLSIFKQQVNIDIIIDSLKKMVKIHKKLDTINFYESIFVIYNENVINCGLTLRFLKEKLNLNLQRDESYLNLLDKCKFFTFFK
jgi:Leucine-rich repeat (LRR) protein